MTRFYLECHHIPSSHPSSAKAASLSLSAFLKACPVIPSSPAAASLTTAENQDRRVLYETLAEQNKLGSTGLLEIQRAFAEVRKEKAHAGDMVQSASGDWKKKS